MTEQVNFEKELEKQKLYNRMLEKRLEQVGQLAELYHDCKLVMSGGRLNLLADWLEMNYKDDVAGDLLVDLRKMAKVLNGEKVFGEVSVEEMIEEIKGEIKEGEEKNVSA